MTDRALVGNESGAMHLGFAALLKLFQADSCFLRCLENVFIARARPSLVRSACPRQHSKSTSDKTGPSNITIPKAAGRPAAPSRPRPRCGSRRPGGRYPAVPTPIGLAIPHNSEAKALGIKMGAPWHLIRDKRGMRDVR